jgi:hypothetical protein
MANKASSSKVPIQQREVSSFELNIVAFMNPQKHFAHTVLFVMAAVFTFVYGVQSPKTSLTLTNFKMLLAKDLKRDLDISNKDDLYKKWNCKSNSSIALQTVDAWGPDSICRCFDRKACAGTACLEVDKTCYNEVVPLYANVFAGYDYSNYNITIAFVFIHISILINMIIESRELQSMDRNTGGEGENQALLTEQLAQAKANTGLTNGKNPAESSSIQNPPPPVNTDGQSGDASTWSKVYMTFMSTQKEVIRLIVMWCLSVIAIGFSIKSVVDKEGLRSDGTQVCDLVNTCMTQSFVGLMTMVVSIVNILWSSYDIFQHFVTKNDKMRHSCLHTLWEDVNHTVAFMLLTASFGALGGVHDDSTILFDMLVVVFIGFLQSVQHHIMVWREDVMAYCYLLKDDSSTRSHIGETLTVTQYVLSYFLYSRLFIFVVMLGSSIVFLERIEPSIQLNDINATWNYYMRNVALLISVLPNIIADISYEITHMTNMKNDNEHTPYVGASFWRRTIFLLYMIVFILFSWKTYEFEKF